MCEVRYQVVEGDDDIDEGDGDIDDILDICTVFFEAGLGSDVISFAEPLVRSHKVRHRCFVLMVTSSCKMDLYGFC